MNHFIIFFILLLLTVNTAYAKENKEQELLKGEIINNYVSRKYILGPNDVLDIKFIDIEELNQEKITITPDGKVVLSLVGSIEVAGLTIDELYILLKEKYCFYLKNPAFRINLNRTRPFMAYVTGAVINPGTYEISTDQNKSYYQSSNIPSVYIERKTPMLSNVLVAAGGITHDADLEHIKITNQLDDTEFEVNLMELLANGDTNQDIYLVPGDRVHVPQLPTSLAIPEEHYRMVAKASFSPKTIPVKVYGYVNKPGLIYLDTSRSLNLNSAITSAGGYLLDSAYAPGRVYVSRMDSNGKLVTTTIDPKQNDMILMPNDIIYVPEKTRPLIGKAFDYITRIIVPFGTFGSTFNSWALMFDKNRFGGAVVNP